MFDETELKIRVILHEFNENNINTQHIPTQTN